MRENDTGVGGVTAVLERCVVCHVGFSDGRRPYVLPMNFGYETEAGTLTLYLHCGKKGRKLDILSRNRRVCVQAEYGVEYRGMEVVCHSSMAYESAVCEGAAELLEDREEKRRGLDLIMARLEPGKRFAYDEKMLDAVGVIRIACDAWCAKRRD